MAEILGIVGSVLTIIDTSWKIMQYLDGVKQGDKARHTLLVEVNSTWLTFQTLKPDIERIDTGQDSSDEKWLEPLKALADRPPGLPLADPKQSTATHATKSVDTQLEDIILRSGHKGIATQIREQLEEILNLLISRSSSTNRLGQAISSLQWPFKEKEVSRIIRNLQSLRQTASLALEQSSLRLGQEIHKSLASMNTTSDDLQFQKILQWLTPLKFRETQQDKLELVVADDCNILESPEYNLWFKYDMRSLWCHGLPGAGKSVAAACLCKRLVDHHYADNVAIMISFCSFGDIETQCPRNIMASFLKQVLQTTGSSKVPKDLKEIYSKAAIREDKNPLDLDLLKRVLKDLLKTFDMSYILLDGLDEVTNLESRAAIIQAAHELGASVKVLLTSRYSEDIASALNDIQTCKKCQTKSADRVWRCNKCNTFIICNDCHRTVRRNESEGHVHELIRERRWQDHTYVPTATSIQDYVQGRIDAEPKLSRLIGSGTKQLAVRKRVIEEVTAKSENLFLIARLHMNSLVSNCVTVGNIKLELRRLSSGLNDLYSDTLARIEQSLDDSEFRCLRRLLVWVAWGQTPLSMEALGHALAIEPEVAEIDTDFIPDIHEVVSWSSGLLIVDGLGFVRVIHPTAQRFFIERRAVQFPKGDAEIAHDCLHYLTMDCFKHALDGPNKRSLFRRRCLEYPLFSYAVRHSFVHVGRSEEKDDDLRAAQFLLSPSRSSFSQALYFLDPSWETAGHVSALHIAAWLGMNDLLDAVLKEQHGDVDICDDFGVTPLMYAARRGDAGLEAIDQLLKAGADPSRLCHRGMTALIRAVYGNSIAVVNRLVQQQDIAINAVPSERASILSPAIILACTPRTSPDILRSLLCRKDLNPNLTTSDGFSPCHQAVYYENSRALKEIIAHSKTDVNLPDSLNQWTPLFHSAANNDVTCTELLLDHGADIDRRALHQGTPLMRAADYRALETVKVLIKRGASVAARDTLNRTVLHSAACNKSFAVLEYLLREAPDIELNAQGSKGETALHDACEILHEKSIRSLVEHGARCDIPNANDELPVDLLHHQKRLDLATILQGAQGADIETRPRARKSLYRVIETDPSKAVKKRIETASLDELNSVDTFLGTPLHHACRHGRADVVSMLLLAGVDTELANSFGRRALHFVIIYYNYTPQALEILLRHGVNVDAAPEPGIALWEWILSQRGPADYLALELFEHGAQIDGSSKYLQRALHLAVEEDHALAVRRLVEAGASIYEKERGETAIDLAETIYAREVLEYFKTLGVVDSDTNSIKGSDSEEDIYSPI